MNFKQIKVQRALRCLEIAKHPQYMPLPVSADETPGANDVHVQLRPDLKPQFQPAPETLRNGSIYVISRNVPAKNIRPGMVLLMNLQRAASVLADDTYRIASVEEIEAEMKRQDTYRKEMAERDRQIRMQSQGVENNINIQQAPPAPINVQLSIADLLPPGMKIVREDEAPAPRKRRSRKAAAAEPGPETGTDAGE